MRIVSTSDVQLADLRQFADALRLELEAEVDESQVCLRAADPPSWVTFLAETSWWTQLLSAYGALYVAELVKEAAKETWRNRSKGLVFAKTTGDQLGKLAESIVEHRKTAAFTARYIVSSFYTTS